jgi:hypothetical protein
MTKRVCAVLAIMQRRTTIVGSVTDAEDGRGIFPCLGSKIAAADGVTHVGSQDALKGEAERTTSGAPYRA